jgi:uncharacterized coiled-coil protein SlyX
LGGEEMTAEERIKELEAELKIKDDLMKAQSLHHIETIKEFVGRSHRLREKYKKLCEGLKTACEQSANQNQPFKDMLHSNTINKLLKECE